VSDKTEEASPRRLRKAREEGDSGASAYAAQALAFVVAVALVPSAVRALAAWAADGLRAAIAQAAAPGAARFDAESLATSVVALTFPVLVAAGIAGAVAHVVQTGGAMASKRLTPKLERLNPFTGFRNFFSTTRLFAVVRALFAGVFVAWSIWRASVDVSRGWGWSWRTSLGRSRGARRSWASRWACWTSS
jgi:flagellar biosynthesis protein FlhB